MELLDDVVPSMWAELLNDRSFEGVIPQANWCYFDGTPNFCDRKWTTNETWVLDQENPFNGRQSAKLTATRSKPASLAQSPLSVSCSETGYQCSGFFRADNSALRVSAILKTCLPDGKWVTLASAVFPRLSGDWEKRTVKLVPRFRTETAVFEIRAEGRGQVWIDKLSLMPSDNLNGWRRDVISSIKAARPDVMRWGGSTCDPGEYRWKNGIGDRDFRTPFKNKVWGRIDPNDVGIDEFCQFCELVQAQPLICLSFSDGPESAADLVDYCNAEANTTWGAKRASHGHPKPYRVKYWQVGNEISGDDEAYLKDFQKFIQLMKRADPGIALMASFPSQKLLDRVGADIAYIGPHHYTPDFAGCDRDFVNLARMIENTPGCAHIKMAVTEWNVSAGDWGLGRGRLMTLAGALLNARYLHVLMRHSDKVEIACRSNIANSFGSGIIETSLAGFLERPSYHVMRLYARHAMPVPLKVEAPADGPDVFACASENQQSATLFAINASAEPVDWSFEFSGLKLHAVNAEVICDTLDQRQPDVMNHWTAPDRVKTVAARPLQNSLTLPALSVVAIHCED